MKPGGGESGGLGDLGGQAQLGESGVWGALQKSGRQTANSGEAKAKTSVLPTPTCGHSSANSGRVSNTNTSPKAEV